MVPIAIGVHELAAMSERRIERLVNPAYSELPAFLVGEGGLNSGFMIAHCTAAALGKFLVNTGCPLPGVALAGQGHALIKTHETWTLHKYFFIRYTQYPIIRKGLIRNSAEFLRKFKKRALSGSNLRNASKNLRNGQCSDFQS